MSKERKQFLILCIVCTVVWFMIGIQHNDIVGTIILSIFGGVISAIILLVVYLFIMNMNRKL